MINKELLQQRVDEGIRLVKDKGLYEVSDYTKNRLLAVAYSVHCGGDDNSIVDIDPTLYSETVMFILASQNHNSRIGIITTDEIDLLVEQYGEHAEFVINLLAVSRNPGSGYSEMKVSETDPLPINEVLATTLADDALLTLALTMYSDIISIILHDLSEHIFSSGIVEHIGVTTDEEESSDDHDNPESEEVEGGDNAEIYSRHSDIYSYIDTNGKYDAGNYEPQQLGCLAVCTALGYDLEKMLELDPTVTSVANMIYHTACMGSDDLEYNPLPDYVRESIEMGLLVITLSDDPRGSEVREMLDNGVPTDEIAKILASDSVMLSRIAEDYPDAIFNIVAAILTLPLSHPLRMLETAIGELGVPFPPLPDKYRGINSKEVLSGYQDKEDTTH